jgi:aminoglycoside phosphotransferase (APT) family kinase protein
MSTSDIDVSAIIASLNMGPVTSIAPVTGGADTAIWRVEHDRTVSALRVLRPEQAAVAAVEQIAMRAASAVLPVPEIRAVTTWSERPVMLIEWMPGEPLLGAVIADPENAKAWGRLLGEAQARLHKIAAPAGLPSPSQSWLGRLNPELPAGVDGSTLLHFDFHPLNVLVHDGQISGVIDWTNAAVGDARLDAARTWAILDCAPIQLPNLDKKSSRYALSQFSGGWREAYEERHGPLPGIDPFFRWARTATMRDLAKHSGGDGLATVADVIKIIT